MSSPVSVGRFVGWLVCKHDCTKSAERLYMNLRWRMVLGPEQTHLTFGADPVMYFLIFFNIARHLSIF